MPLVFQSVLDCEHAAPGMSVEIELIQAECRPNLLHLFAKPLHRPEAGILRLIRIRRAELVIVNELDSFLREKILEALKVLMRRTRPAMQREHLDWTQAYTFGPDMKFAVHLRHLDAAHFYSAHSCILSSRAGRPQAGLCV